ncbi:hypothetical protein [Flavobacterium granuli]|nr:hypothetical protein [Flavobacterium granuli]
MTTMKKYFRIIFILITILQVSSCSNDEGDKGDKGDDPIETPSNNNNPNNPTDTPTGNNGGNNSTETSIYGGVWVRLLGPSGDETDIAIGGIKGEAPDRVYMCEKKGSVGLYKGTISGDVIVWDSEHGLPNSQVKLVGNELELSYPSVSWSIPTMYAKGSWSGGCVPLEISVGTGTDNGQVLFWTETDLGVGSITVTCNGINKTMNQYYTSGSPSCGSTGAANFTLAPGDYSYTASGGTLLWSGTITVTAGGCLKTQLRSSDAGGATGAGQAMFWTQTDLGVGAITISCNGITKTINQYYSSGAPSCGAAGGANFDLDPGTYSYSASGGLLTWSGTITVTSGGCSKMELTSSGAEGGSTGTNTGQAMFWTASDFGVGSITVTCNGSSKTIDSYYSSGVPDCGATGGANFNLDPGTYSYSASGGSLKWSGNITVTNGGCFKMQLTH